MSTCIGRTCERQEDLEHRAALARAVHPHDPTGFVDRPRHDRQPEPGAFARLLGREEWIEDPLPIRLRTPGPLSATKSSAPGHSRRQVAPPRPRAHPCRCRGGAAPVVRSRGAGVPALAGAWLTVPTAIRPCGAAWQAFTIKLTHHLLERVAIAPAPAAGQARAETVNLVRRSMPWAVRKSTAVRTACIEISRPRARRRRGPRAGPGVVEQSLHDALDPLDRACISVVTAGSAPATPQHLDVVRRSPPRDCGSRGPRRPPAGRSRPASRPAPLGLQRRAALRPWPGTARPARSTQRSRMSGGRVECPPWASASASAASCWSGRATDDASGRDRTRQRPRWCQARAEGAAPRPGLGAGDQRGVRPDHQHSARCDETQVEENSVPSERLDCPVRPPSIRACHAPAPQVQPTVRLRGAGGVAAPVP